MKILAMPIEAAAWFKLKEKPQPVKFRYKDEEGMVHQIKVDQIQFVEEIKIAGIKAYVYRCQSQVGGMEKLYELKYLVNDCRWELYKM